MSDFAEWLNNELIDRQWKPADLVRRAGIDSGYLSRILNREQKNIGPETINDIARALKYPPETVYRAAGLLPPLPSDQALIEEWRHLLAQLSQRQQRELLALARLMIEETHPNFKQFEDNLEDLPPEAREKLFQDFNKIIHEWAEDQGLYRTK